MLKFIKNLFSKFVPASLQQPLRWLIISIRDMWLPIYRIERSGLTVILIGQGACDPHIIYLLYGDYLKGIRIGTVLIWSLNRVMRRWEETADLIIFRHRYFKPGGAIARRMLIIPHYVMQSIKLPPSEANLLAAFSNHSTKNDLKKIREAGFRYEITQDPAQMDFFYHQMHRPYIQDRHRHFARILSWDAFKQAYEKMELLLICREGLPVGGCLNLQTGDCYTVHVNGVLNADRELLNAGVMSALYWFSMVEAHRRGCATVNLGCSRPFLKNGVLINKKKWNSRIVMNHRERELWLLPCGNRPPMHRFLEENPFFCERDGRLLSLIFLGSHTVLNSKELSSYLRRCLFQGDGLSTWIVLLNNEWAARTEAIQNILSELPQPSRILDLSHAPRIELPELIQNGKMSELRIR